MTSVANPFPPVEGVWRRWRTAALVPVVLGLLFISGYWPRRSAQNTLTAEATSVGQSPPRVKLSTAVAVEGGRSLVLPGSLVASRQAMINARATGYVHRWRVDIGDRVRAGEVLADLDTPELDQQLQQARATLKQQEAALEQAAANRDFAKVTASRQDLLLGQGLVAKQDADQADAQFKVGEANVHAGEANVAAAQANVRQLSQLVSFGHVVAPFDGRITQRNVDVGSLVIAGGAAGSVPLFRIEAIDPIRVFVQVPQAFASSVKDAEAAGVSIRQIPGRVFEGRVTRTAGTLDPALRTLNVEIDIPNPNGELLGGMYAEVTIAVAAAHRAVRVPSSAVITDARGNRVATVNGTGRVHLVEVVRGQDNGREIELVEGLVGGEQVIASPGGDVVDGARVEPVAPTER
jgi:membrane fusion protein (multidrug efflux system)